MTSPRCTFCDAPATGTNTLPDGTDPVPCCTSHGDARTPPPDTCDAQGHRWLRYYPRGQECQRCGIRG